MTRFRNDVKRLLRILSARDRKGFLLLLGVVLVMAFLEVLGVASILPFMSLVARPDLVYENAYLHWVYEAFGFTSRGRFLFATGMAVLVFITLANAFSLFTQWLQSRIVNDTAYRLEKRMLETYAYQPYAFFLAGNTADMGKQVLNEVNQFVRGVLMPLTDVGARAAVALFIFAVLVLVDPLLAAIVLGVLGGLYAVIFFGIRRYLARLGVQRAQAVRDRYKAAGELLTGIKPVKVQHSEAFFIDRFARASKRYADVRARLQVVSAAPRNLIETMAFGVIIAIVLYLLAAGETWKDAIPILSLYVLAGYRLLPSLQNLFKAASDVQHNYLLLEEMDRDLSRPVVLPPRVPGEALPLREAITLEDVTFGYAGTDTPVLSRLSLRIAQGTSVAFVGATGTGKTTLIDLIMGLLQPEEGRLCIDGVPVTPHNVRQWQANVGYVPQEVFFVDDTIARNIAFGLGDEHVDRARVVEAARVANMHAFVEALPKGYDTRIGERGVRLSGGQRQRLGLARALYRAPRVLVLDEATSALDGVTEEAVMQALSRLPQAVTRITIAHRLSTVKACDYIYLLERGRIVAEGRYEALVEANATFRAMARLAS